MDKYLEMNFYINLLPSANHPSQICENMFSQESSLNPDQNFIYQQIENQTDSYKNIEQCIDYL